MNKKIKRNLVCKKIFNETLNWWESILDFILFNKFSCFLRHLKRFIDRLPKYTKLAWEQEVWSYEYLYDLIEMKMKEFLKAQEEDTWHTETKRRAKQIRICLAYLDRYRNWHDYYNYPIDDIKFVDCPEHDGCKQMIHTNKINEIKRKGANAYQKFNYDMFWKRFLQWHQGWWI